MCRQAGLCGYRTRVEPIDHLALLLQNILRSLRACLQLLIQSITLLLNGCKQPRFCGFQSCLQLLNLRRQFVRRNILFNSALLHPLVKHLEGFHARLDRVSITQGGINIWQLRNEGLNNVEPAGNCVVVDAIRFITKCLSLHAPIFHRSAQHLERFHASLDRVRIIQRRTNIRHLRKEGLNVVEPTGNHVVVGGVFRLGRWCIIQAKFVDFIHLSRRLRERRRRRAKPLVHLCTIERIRAPRHAKHIRVPWIVALKLPSIGPFGGACAAKDLRPLANEPSQHARLKSKSDSNLPGCQLRGPCDHPVTSGSEEVAHVQRHTVPAIHAVEVSALHHLMRRVRVRSNEQLQDLRRCLATHRVRKSSACVEVLVKFLAMLD